MLTSEQVCGKLAISHRTLMRMIQRGDIAASKTTIGPGGRYRFTEKAVQDYLRRNRVRPDKKAAAS